MGRGITYGRAQHALETEVTNTISKDEQAKHPRPSAKMSKQSSRHHGTEGGRRALGQLVASLHALHVSRLVVALVAEMRRTKAEINLHRTNEMHTTKP